MNTGEKPVVSRHGLVTTLAWGGRQGNMLASCHAAQSNGCGRRNDPHRTGERSAGDLGIQQ
ncbi:MAG: hypothetical protein ACLSFJ_00210 [Holdemania filiformis]